MSDTAATHPVPDAQGGIYDNGCDGRYRVLTVDHVPFNRFREYGDGGPAIVAVGKWAVSTSSISGMSSASVLDADDGMHTLNVNAVSADGNATVEDHPLNGTKYPTRRDANMAAYNAGVTGFMVYTRDLDLDRLGLGLRFNRHVQPDGTGCPWSGCSVVAPECRTEPGNRRCPVGCPASDIEIEPEGEPGSPEGDGVVPAAEQHEHEQAGGDLLPATSAPTNASVQRMLDLNTGHLPEHIGSTALAGIDGVVAYSTEWGWLMWVPADPAGDDKSIPAEVLAIQMYARERDCDYVLFDVDGAVNADLPHWDW